MKNILFIICACLGSTLFAQFPYNIESVEYDPSGDRWFVSNGSSNLLSTIDAGESWEYFGNAQANYGMEVMGDYLFTIAGGQIRAYALADGFQVSSVNVTGSNFLNGMGSDGNGTLIVSDFGTGRIIKIDASSATNMSVSTLVANTGTTPNGVVVDVANNRAVVVNWGGNADILGIDLDSGAITTLVDGTGLGNCDGIDMDSQGRFYVSSWSPNAITRFSADFSEQETVVNSGLSSPADISYSIETDTLGVANSGNAQVTFHNFYESGESTNDLQVEAEEWVKLQGDRLMFDLLANGTFELRAYSINGQMTAFEELRLFSGDTTVELSRLPRGFSKATLINVVRTSGGSFDNASFKRHMR